MVEIEGGEIQTDLTDQEKQRLQALNEKDIKVVEKIEKNLKGDKYTIYVLNIKGEEYTAIQIPKSIREKKFQETHLGAQLLQFHNKDWYPAFLENKQEETLQTINKKEWLLWQRDQVKNTDGTAHVNIEAKNKSKDKDILRE